MEHIRGNPGVGHDLDKAPPDHRILSKARARFGPAWYEWFFGLIIWACRDAGLIDGDRLILDATLIKANASLDSLSSRPLHAQLPTAEDSLSQVWGEGPVEVEGPRDPEGPAVDGKPVTLLNANQRQVSSTDPDSSLVSRDTLAPRPLREVHPVTSDAREGPKKALCGGRYLHKGPAILELAMGFEPATC